MKLNKISNTKLFDSSTPFYRNKRLRGLFYQIILIAIVLFFFWSIFNNTLHNMDKRGIQTGFRFLGLEAGFPILFSPFIEYKTGVSSYATTFFIGLLNTILISVLGIIFATIIGLVVGLARLSSNWLISQLANMYIEIFRNIPLLLQIMFWYFAILIPFLPHVQESGTLFNGAVVLNKKGLFFPQPIIESGFIYIVAALAISIVISIIYRRRAKRVQAATGKQLPIALPVLGILVSLPLIAYFALATPLFFEMPVADKFSYKGGLNLIPELTALVFALSIYTAAFIAENIRGGVLAVSHGQTEASYSLGLNRWQTLRLVIIPQALRVIIPPQTSQYLNLTKNSSLATAIGYPDLVAVFAGTALNQTGKAVEIIAMTMLVYLILSLSTSALMNLYNKKVAIIER